jgi:hypothetical protein
MFMYNVFNTYVYKNKSSQPIYWHIYAYILIAKLYLGIVYVTESVL